MRKVLEALIKLQEDLPFDIVVNNKNKIITIQWRKLEQS